MYQFILLIKWLKQFQVTLWMYDEFYSNLDTILAIIKQYNFTTLIFHIGFLWRYSNVIISKKIDFKE